MTIHPATLELAEQIKKRSKNALAVRSIGTPDEGDLNEMLLANFDLAEVIELAEEALNIGSEKSCARVSD